PQTNMTRATTTKTAQGLDSAVCVCAASSGSRLRMLRKWYEIEHKRRPAIITGIVWRRIARRPTRSISIKAIRVQIKLVNATDTEVKIGEVKPRREKIVAEKYIREF
ncbi:MAG: hypothetical protein Q9190_006358, partial [Brigantiaea leucoxantha]